VNVQQANWKNCNQKWRNLVKDYHFYKAHYESAGIRRRNPPWFFKFMDEILNDARIVRPVPGIDTISGD